MNDDTSTVPEDWKMVIDGETIKRSLSRIAYEVLEKDDSTGPIAIVGIRTAGEYLAERLLKRLQQIDPDKEYSYGVIDITLYRDDLSHTAEQPTIKGTELDFSISGQRIILVDDVLFTGRTVRAALDAIIDFGRPDCVELAVLADRGHRELPIRPDYVGKNLPTKKSEFVRVQLEEMGGADGVYLLPASSARGKK